MPTLEQNLALVALAGEHGATTDAVNMMVTFTVDQLREFMAAQGLRVRNDSEVGST